MIRRPASIAFPLVAASIAVLAACGSSESGGGNLGFATGPLMLPGENCLRCHSDRSQYPEAPAWTAGGTVFESATAESSRGVTGAMIFLTDKTGRTVKLSSNSAGNFYTREPLTPPFRVALEYEGQRAEMPIEAPAGSCNACHSHPDPTGGTLGRIRIPSANPPAL